MKGLIRMTYVQDYLETFTDEVVEELEDNTTDKTDYIHTYSESNELDREIADRVSGRADGSYTFDHEDSAENLRAFMFTDYWNDFTDYTGMTLMSEFDDIEAFETELRAWLLRFYVWPQAIERVAVSRGVSADDVRALL